MNNKFTRQYDPVRAIQYINLEPAIFQNHVLLIEYITTCMFFDNKTGVTEMVDSISSAIEDAVFMFLLQCVVVNEIEDPLELYKIAEDYCAYIGLGTLSFNAKNGEATAIMTSSHVDEAWLKNKKQKSISPINFPMKGFLAAILPIMSAGMVGDYKVTEVESISMGAKQSKFTIAKKGN